MTMMATAKANRYEMRRSDSSNGSVRRRRTTSRTSSSRTAVRGGGAATGPAMMFSAVVVLLAVVIAMAQTTSAFSVHHQQQPPATHWNHRQTSTTTARRTAASSSSIGTQLRMAYGLHEVSEFYQTYPAQAAVLTCGVKASVADFIAQVRGFMVAQENEQQQSASTAAASSFSLLSVENESGENFEIESKRTLAYTLYGGVFVGFMCHMEYDHLFPVLFGTEHTVKVVLEKLLFDNFVSAPLMWIPPAYVIKSLVYGKDPVRDGLKRYVDDVRNEGLLFKYWAIWLPAQAITFGVVPDHLRVAFMATVSFFWFMLFSCLTSSSDEAATQVKQQQGSITEGMGKEFLPARQQS